ncbi:hypothetical protein JCM15415_21920 [Methanobacterium movens]
MYVTKSVSIELEDLMEISKKIEDGEVASLSHFIRNAIKNELNLDYTNLNQNKIRNRDFK